VEKHQASGTTAGYSDARLFCENKQANLKNKPKMGNLTEKEAERAFDRKIQKIIKKQVRFHTKTGSQIRKNKPKMSRFTQKHAQILFSSKLKEQNLQEIWWKRNPQCRNLQKNKPKKEENLNQN